MISYQHLVLVLAVMLILFGGKRLPELASSLGKSLKEFKKGTEGGGDESGSPQAASPAVATMASGTCVSCRTPLQAEWTHCPRCGAATPQGSAP